MGQVLGSLDLEGSWLGCNLRNRGIVHLNKAGLLREAWSVVVWLSGATRSHRAILSGEALSLGPTTLTTVIEASTGETVVWLHGLLEELEDLMDQLESIWAVKKTGLKRESVVLLLSEEVSLVLVLDLLLSADFWELVVGHVEGLSVEVLVVEADSSLSCRVWLLVADECSDSLRSAVLAVLVLSLNDLDALDLTGYHTQEKAMDLAGYGNLHPTYKRFLACKIIARHESQAEDHRNIARAIGAGEIFVIKGLMDLARDSTSGLVKRAALADLAKILGLTKEQIDGAGGVTIIFEGAGAPGVTASLPGAPLPPSQGEIKVLPASNKPIMITK